MCVETPVVKVGAYVVLRRIGVGGWADVYEGLRPETRERVAIKVLREELVRDAQAVAQFLREARVVSGIRHRGVVAVLESGTLDTGRPYLVMELLSGEALDARVARVGKRPPGEVLTLLEGILDAVAAVHEAGVLHRDLKPSNVFLIFPPAGEAVVKILDFGLAGEAALDSGGGHGLTGTPAFMAPERLRGKPATVGSDLYALGAIAVYLLTGVAPFGEEPELIVARQARGVSAEARPLAPAPFWRPLDRLLAVDPGARPGSAGEALGLVRAARQELLQASGESAPRPLGARPPPPPPNPTMELDLSDVEVVK